MNKLIATLLIAAALPGVAAAQDRGEHAHGGDHARPAPAAPPQARPPAPAFQQRPAPGQPHFGGGQPQPFQPRPAGDPRRFGGGQAFDGAQPGRFNARGTDDARRFGGGQPGAGQQPPAFTGGDPRRFDRGPGGYDRHFDSRPGGYPQPGHQPGPGAGYRGDPNRNPFRPDGYRGGGAQPFAGAPRGGYGYRPDYNRGGGQWDRGWHQDRRFDWGSYRRYNGDLFRLPRYSAPYGWNYGYQRFGIGVAIDEALFAPDYWIGDPYTYRLPPVDGPYRWVRYYNDALLIDIDTGEVVDVVYGIFY